MLVKWETMFIVCGMFSIGSNIVVASLTFNNNLFAKAGFNCGRFIKQFSLKYDRQFQQTSISYCYMPTEIITFSFLCLEWYILFPPYYFTTTGRSNPFISRDQRLFFSWYDYHFKKLKAVGVWLYNTILKATWYLLPSEKIRIFSSRYTWQSPLKSCRAYLYTSSSMLVL